MSEFFRDYGFFILVAFMMFFCHFGHRHGGSGHDHNNKRSGEDDRGQ
jgi:hypothetical protein